MTQAVTAWLQDNSRQIDRRFIAENLELRTLLSTYEVTSLAGDGSAGTLGAAIAQANAATDGDQYITFDSSLTATGPATIPLNGSALELNGSSGTIKIIGPTGDDGIIIDARQTSGVFQIDGGSVEIDNLTITGGSANTGAGVLNDGWLSINNCIIAGNSATGDGGGVANKGALSIANSTFVNNSAGGNGGGLANYNFADQIIDSTFIDNHAAVAGAAIENQGAAIIIGSTFTENTAGGPGGGMDESNGQSKIFSSTFTGNLADTGAAVYLGSGGLASIATSTFADNTSNEGAGGIDGDGTLQADDSIIAENTPADVGSGVSANGTYNLIGDGTGGFSTDSSQGNLLGTTSVKINPELAPLGDYGGPTQTMPLLSSSPALGVGPVNPVFSGTPITTDQRGFDLPADSSTDIGAFESLPIVVNTVSGDVVGPGQMDVPSAQNLSNALGGQPIGYATTLFPGAEGYYGALWVSWPTSVTEGTDISLCVSNGSELNIQSWGLNWLDQDGAAIETDQLSTGSGTFTYSTGSYQLLTADLTAYDGASNAYTLPAWTIGITPAAPTSLAPTSTLPTEVDLSWTDNSAIASDDLIYESTDDGLTFTPIDDVTSAGSGHTNTYQATGLNAGTEYVFEVTSQTDYIESSTTGLLAASTPFETPTLDVEGTGTVVEGQPYEIDVTADYPDGEPGVVNYYTVNWSDGYTGNYYYPPGSDPTQPLAITHTFNAGYPSPTVSVTAVDSSHGSWTADPQSVAVTPVAPTLSSVTASANSITAHWSNTSSISTGTTVLLSTDGTNYFEYGDAAAGATSLTIANLSLDTHYWVETLTDSVNGISPASSSLTASTPYVAPTLNVSAPNPAIAGEPYVLNLSATYADGTPLADQVDHWLVNYGDGNGTQTYSTGAIQSPTTNSAGGTHTITVIAVDGNGNQISYPSQTVTYSTPDGNQDVTTQGPNTIIIASGVDVGGEEWLPVTDSGGAGLSLTYRSTDSDVMAVMDSRADTGNNYEVLVKGVSFGQANIVATDNAGSIGQTGTFWDQPLSVTTSNSTSSEIEGGNYNSSNMPGFYFSTVYPSVTAINVQFNTDGSTLPSSLLGWLNSGSMTIPAGITRQFEAFTVSDDGKIAPTRGAVVNIEMRGDTYGRAGLTAVMDVTNTDVPGITVNGTQDDANLQLDRQNDPSLLATIGFRIEKDGTIVSSTLSWNPGQDVIWPTDKIGTVGTDDLASLPGATFDVNGAHYTWNGLPPAQLWDQAIGGSSSTDSTTITISVTVVKAATTVVPLASAAPFNTADKTQGGIWINVSGSGEQPDPDPTVDGDVVVGAGITLTIGYAGPDPLAQQGLFSDIGWTIPGATADPKTATAIANYTATPDKGVVTVLDAAALSSPVVHYYFLPDNQLNDVRTVSLNASDANFGYHASAKIRVITPDSTFSAVTTNDRPAVTVHNVPVLNNKLVLQLGTFYSSAGVKFFGSVTPPSTTSGSAYIIQLVSDYSALASAGSMRFDSITDALDNPPAFYTVPNYGKTVTTPAGINTPLAFKFGNVTGPIDDSPDISLLPLDIFASRSFSAADYEMWQAGSPVTDSIPVPLRKLTWSFSATAVRIGLGSAAQDWLVISETCSFDGLPGGGLIQSVLAGPEPQWSLFAGNDTTVTVPYP